MRVQNLNWKDHPTLADIYGDLPRKSHTLMIRRLQFAGHCIRAQDKPVSDLVMWRLPCNKRGRRPLTHSDVFIRDVVVKKSVGPSGVSRNVVWLSYII